MNCIRDVDDLPLAPPELIRVGTRRWTFDLNYRNKTNCPELTHPPGYFERSFPKSTVRNNDPNLTVKRSWDIALGPVRQVPMNFFILWMAGNSISIFPIMMVMMMFFRPIQALFSVQATFKIIEGSQAPLQRLVYVIGNLVTVAMAVYKCHTMGLLPTYASDWLSFIEPPQRAEWSAGGYVL